MVSMYLVIDFGGGSAWAQEPSSPLAFRQENNVPSPTGSNPSLNSPPKCAATS